MSFGSGLLVGGAISALVTLLADPRRGAARRARIIQKSGAFLRHGIRNARGRLSDARHRLRGSLHELRARLVEEAVNDDVLVERVRAQIGRPLSHPHALQVSARNGVVVLRGDVLEEEMRTLLASIAHVRGVKKLINEVRPTRD